MKKTTEKNTSPVHVSRSKRTSDDIWREEPELIRNFIAARPNYEHLCIEVEYILKNKLQALGIETAAITSRAKTLDSFLEKIQRKNYKFPSAEITDLAGARVVCLYQGDIEKIGQTIRSEFEIVEEIDKLSDLDSSQFGYLARHYLVRLGDSSSGARYDGLKSLVCEIQVRTVVQDAWAIIQHHMVYKNEAQTPRSMLRKLNGLAGLFETADDQFESIRTQRVQYLESIRTTTSEPSLFLDNDFNLDSLTEYLKWKFPDKGVEAWDGQTRVVFDALVADGQNSLKDIDQIINSTADERARVVAKLEPLVSKNSDGTIPANLEPALALALIRPDGESGVGFSEDWVKIISKERAPDRPVRKA